MDLGLKGKTAIVTGASQGIGREIARALHREGVALVMVARSRAALDSLASELGGGRDAVGGTPAAFPVVADLAMRTEIERVVLEANRLLGHIDILVNNAANTHTGNFFAMPERAMEEAWQVKGLGYVRMVREVARLMMEQRSGRILNIIGNTARVPTTDFIFGSMVNAALANFTRGISRELARNNIRINSISPGWTLTERQKRSFELQAAAHGTTLDEIEQREARAIPLDRLVSTREIADLALLLVSDVLPAMTGEDVVIDGGATVSI